MNFNFMENLQKEEIDIMYNDMFNDDYSIGVCNYMTIRCQYGITYSYCCGGSSPAPSECVYCVRYGRYSWGSEFGGSMQRSCQNANMGNALDIISYT